MAHLSFPYLALIEKASSGARDIGEPDTKLGLTPEEELACTRAVATRPARPEAKDLESLIHLGSVGMGKVPGVPHRPERHTAAED